MDIQTMKRGTLLYGLIIAVSIMFECKSYDDFKEKVKSDKTGDGIKWNSPLVNVEEINELIFNDR